MKKQHFNLTELCVIVAAVILTAAVMLPALEASQQGAQGALCGDNLKKLGQIQAAYLEANDDFFTPAMTPAFKPTMTVKGMTSTSRSFAKWPYYMLQTGMVSPGGRDGWELPETFHCPARTQSQFSSFQYDCYGKLDYGMNYAFAPASLNGLYQNIAQIENPADVIIFADAKQLSWPNDTGSYQIPCKVNIKGSWGNADSLSKMDENVYLGHGGAHVSYVDGHVNFIPAKSGNTAEGRREFWFDTYCGAKNFWSGRKK